MAEFDLAVIGAGAAGLSVAAGAAQLGVRVALIERGRMGGDCLNFGCVPSKALLAAGHAAQAVRAASRFGVRAGEPDIDWPAVRARVQAVVAAIAPMDSAERFEGLGATVLRGRARFTGAATLDVDGMRIGAARIVIAAGSRPAIPAIPGLADVPYLTNATLWDLAEKPAHLLILGGGPMGLEIAQAHAGLGCRVTLVEQGRLAAREEPELVDVLRARLAADGVAIHEHVRVARVEPGPALVLADGTRLDGSHLLVAAGRAPNTEDLDLAAAGIAHGPNGIATDRALRCLGHRRIYAVGDIADPAGLGPRAFTHVAGHHASMVVRHALFRLPVRLGYAALPRVCYTAPELAQVGLTEAEARATGRSVTVIHQPLRENDRAQTAGVTEGRVKLVLGARGRVLGVGIAAPHAGEMIGAWTLAVARRIPLSAMAGMIVPYPTLAEAPRRAAGAYFTPALFAARTRKLVRMLRRLPDWARA